MFMRSDRFRRTRRLRLPGRAVLDNITARLIAVVCVVVLLIAGRLVPQHSLLTSR